MPPPKPAQLEVRDIDQETGTEIPGSRYVTTRDDFVQANAEHDDIRVQVNDLRVGDVAEFGGGAAVLTRVKRLS